MNSIQRDDALIVIGGAGRNVGKTEFSCRLIEKVSGDHEVYGLKVSAIFPDELLYHGRHGEGGLQQCIFEEFRDDTGKDTSRMLRAGARKVFFISCANEDVLASYREFRGNLPKDVPIVCESNSLASFFKPALHIIVVPHVGAIKKRAEEKMRQADIVVRSDGQSGFPQLDVIAYSAKTGWYLSS